MNHMIADGPDSPWNQVDRPEREIEVTVSVTLSKTMRILVDDYRAEEDDEGHPSFDYSDCNLHKAVEEQSVLPQNLALFTERMFGHDINLKAAGMPKYLKDAITDCKGWHVDDYEVIKE